MQKASSTDRENDDLQLEKIRALILGNDNHLVTDSVKKDARKIVSDVLSEALHDREKNDGSVNKVLQPLVESSVEQSVTHNSEKLVSSLYPLVGSLVRKSVAAFLSDFMEKTNELLENSLTYKGLKWRIKAWQAGVSYAQYAASQTFVYRVEHVFLIHRETGLLLKSIDIHETGQSDADLISSMLTAINDFVGDSFLANEDGLKEQLQSVSTDNFNLLIKPGPQAIVVAAVIGSPPQKLTDQLQLTLEDIHRLYINELNSFEGDNQNFENAENLLRDCLFSKQKASEEKARKPIFSWAILVLFIVFFGSQTLTWFQKEQLIATVSMLTKQPGIIVNKTFFENGQLTIEVLRDPNAIKVSKWLENQEISSKKINVQEFQYWSLEPEILFKRAQSILDKYPSISSQWQNNTLNLSGSLNLYQKEALVNHLMSSGFVDGGNLSTLQIITAPTSKHLNSNEIKHQLFNRLIGRISAIQLDFTKASSTITPDMQLYLQKLYQHVQQLDLLAQELHLNFGLLIMGSSDSSGVKLTNDKLSIKRAENTASTLTNMGLEEGKIFVSGLGQVDILGVKDAARKVMFNVIFVDNEKLNEPEN